MKCRYGPDGESCLFNDYFTGWYWICNVENIVYLHITDNKIAKIR